MPDMVEWYQFGSVQGRVGGVANTGDIANGGTQ